MGNQPSNGGAPGGQHHGQTPAEDSRRHNNNARGNGGSSFSGYGGASGGSYSSSGTGGGVSAAPGVGNQQQKMMPRSSSDASMTGVGSADADNTLKLGNLTVENWLDDDTVPTVFRWEHGGRQVYITGTFNGWSRQIPMHRSGNDFTYIHNLKRGKHAFKFIVDDEWRFAPDQPTVADIEGRINNFIDVTDFKAYTGDREFEKEKAAAEYGFVADEEETSPDSTTSGSEAKDSDGSSNLKTGPDKDGEVFSQTMPDMDEYTKEPPPLPPHLRHIILNKPPQLQDTAALPVPQHVALNHLYCTAIKDNMMVLGITQRYKTKFVTTVYYSPCASK